MKNKIVTGLATNIILCISLTSCGQAEQNQKTDLSMKMNADNNMKFEISKSEDEWKKTLSESQYYILREKGTERPYSGKFLLHKDKGNYTCAACGNVLFSSESKFDSHCGWPSFDKEVSEGRIITHEDNTLGMSRIEIMCAKCGGHLGHVFDDGPTETGLRYCVNSESLGFVNEKEPATGNGQATNPVNTLETITLGGGCFWCIETIFLELKGVVSVESGYSGGSVKNPSYKEVCNGTTGHAEVVQVVFDNSKITLSDILKVFFTVHDPTTMNRQGGDVGTQYRSAIFFRNEGQKKTAAELIAALNSEKVYDNPIVTQVAPFETFYKAEDYHQNYFNNNPDQGYCRMVIQPKKEKFEKVFKNLLKVN